MKRFVTALLITTGVIQLSAAELVWNNEAAFRNWKAEKNVRMTIENNMIKLSDIAFDHHIMIPNLNLDATLYNRVSIIKYFCQKAGFEENQIDVINEKIINAIEYLYFINVKNKKMLIDIGIYERDVETIV